MKDIPMSERTAFMAAVTFMGGYLDAYTYMTRGGVFANNHTGNMAKLGIKLAQGEPLKAWACLVPMLACVLGVLANEWIKHHGRKSNWQRNALVAQMAALAVVSFIPAGVSNDLVNGCLSFITGFQLATFRTCRWGGLNTTICTGNLRSIGQHLYSALAERTPESLSRLGGYTALVLCFALGAGVGVPLCTALGPLAALVGAAISAALAAALALDGRRGETQAEKAAG